jgi:hypothetical protein
MASADAKAIQSHVERLLAEDSSVDAKAAEMVTRNQERSEKQKNMPGVSYLIRAFILSSGDWPP